MSGKTSRPSFSSLRRSNLLSRLRWAGGAAIAGMESFRAREATIWRAQGEAVRNQIPSESSARGSLTADQPRQSSTLAKQSDHSRLLKRGSAVRLWHSVRRIFKWRAKAVAEGIV